ncbi:MAG: hypothetical protein HZB67_00540 [Candidatus Aenigmarchaeota archaeon]|nr:hypothetical protein [Candidatus Aenigmarchaeota archaeon]
MKWQDKMMATLGIGGVCAGAYFYGAYQTEKTDHNPGSSKTERAISAPLRATSQRKPIYVAPVEPEQTRASKLAEKLDFSVDLLAPWVIQPPDVRATINHNRYGDRCFLEEHNIKKIVAGSIIQLSVYVKNDTPDVLYDLNVKLDLPNGFCPATRNNVVNYVIFPSSWSINDKSRFYDEKYIPCFQNAVANGSKFFSEIAGYGGEGKIEGISQYDPTRGLPMITIPKIPYQRYTFSAVLRLGNDEIERQQFDIYTVKFLE